MDRSRLQWNQLPYGRIGYYSDFEAGRYMIEREAPRRQSWLLKLNNRLIGKFRSCQDAIDGAMLDREGRAKQ